MPGMPEGMPNMNEMFNDPEFMQFFNQVAGGMMGEGGPGMPGPGAPGATVPGAPGAGMPSAGPGGAGPEGMMDKMLGEFTSFLEESENNP